MNEEIFPEPIRNLPQADIPIDGITAFLSQSSDHQIIFMQFSQNAELSEHTHAAQWGIVLEGQITMTIGGETRTYGRGRAIFHSRGVPHSGFIHGGYADITFFDQANRYGEKGRL